MRQMKDSGIEWIGEIPQVWGIGRIGSYYSLRNIKVSDREYKPLSVTKQGVLPQLENVAKTDDNDNRKLVREGDFVINSRSDRRNSCGISNYIGSVSLINTVLCPRAEMNGQYYNWLFHTEGFADEFYRWGHGIVNDLWTTNWREMKKISIPVPPLAEQERIAEFLDEKCAEVDALAGEIKEQIATLEEYKRSVITEAVTKGLDASVPMKDSGIEWIGEIPQAWDANRLRNLIVRREGGVWGLEPDDYEQGTICLRVADFNFGKGRFVEDNIDAFTKRKYSYAQILKYKLKKGDILIEKSGGGEKTPVGRAVLFDKVFTALFANFMDRLRFNNEIVNPYFIEYWLRAWYYCGASPYYINQTIGIQNINLSLMLAKQIIFYPSLAEQERIAEFLDAKCAKVDALISEKQNQLATLEEYKKSVIFEYVTGKKEVV